jgi:hypothetical protein
MRRTAFDRVEARRISRFHRQIWDKVRFESGVQNVFMRDSLQRLFEQGYCRTEVAIMFGVSRERVRQWAVGFGINEVAPYGTRMRIWDDTINQFRPVRPIEFDRHRAKLATARRQKAQHQRREDFTAAMVEKIRTFYQTHNRTPLLSEVCALAGVDSVAHLCQKVGYSTNGRRHQAYASYRDVTAILYTRAGLRVRPRGATGHRKGSPHKRRFTDDEVCDIRRRVQDGETQTSLAIEMGCNPITIYNAVHGRNTYANVK